MVQVTVNEGDDLERVLRRFKRQVQKAGIFTASQHSPAARLSGPQLDNPGGRIGALLDPRSFCWRTASQ
jgi:hypothetical protein